jgi:hypothetical protein
MGRLADFGRVAVWHSGLSYIALWAMAFWTLDEGPHIFAAAGCHPDAAQVLFYWICDPARPISILAALANTALTMTAWAPVYVAAATVRPDALWAAVPILAAHIMGLPAALFVSIRLMAGLLDIISGVFRKRPEACVAGAIAPCGTNGQAEMPIPGPHRPAAPRARSRVAARDTFGLRKPGRS